MFSAQSLTVPAPAPASAPQALKAKVLSVQISDYWTQRHAVKFGEEAVGLSLHLAIFSVGGRDVKNPNPIEARNSTCYIGEFYAVGQDVMFGQASFNNEQGKKEQEERIISFRLISPLGGELQNNPPILLINDEHKPIIAMMGTVTPNVNRDGRHRRMRGGRGEYLYSVKSPLITKVTHSGQKRQESVGVRAVELPLQSKVLTSV